MTPPSPWSPGAGRRQTVDPIRAGADRAATLRGLHRPGQPLLLPNAWDAASARAVEAAGFPAVATSSAAVAATLGYDDGEATPVEEMLDAVARIAGAVCVPVTADLERGYGMGPTVLVERLAATGAVGCNLEDSDPRTATLLDADRQADFLSGVRAAAEQAGIGLVVNARIDTYLLGAGTADEMLTETIRRAGLYLAAGADCVYPILAAEPRAIGALTRQIGGPVNILSTPDTFSLPELADLGVARISFGAGLYRVSQGHLDQMLYEIAAGGDPQR